VVTARLRTAIEHSPFTGVRFAAVRITTSDTFAALYGSAALPAWAWLQVHGTAGADDFGAAPQAQLVVSQRAYQLLQQFQLAHCGVERYGG
jgi:hypothetical protein